MGCLLPSHFQVVGSRGVWLVGEWWCTTLLIYQRNTTSAAPLFETEVIHYDSWYHTQELVYRISSFPQAIRLWNQLPGSVMASLSGHMLVCFVVFATGVAVAWLWHCLCAGNLQWPTWRFDVALPQPCWCCLFCWGSICWMHILG
jgi:hypothetical protein